jgi:hypothetical protein
MTLDYSDAPGIGATDYVIEPPEDEVWDVHRLLVMIEDAGAFDAAKYGNAIDLTNGITLQIENAAGVINQIIPTYHPVKANADWGEWCYDVDVKSWGTGNEVMLVRWTFAKGGTTIKLSGKRGEKLVVTLNDDFTGLVEHHMTVQGNKYTVA